MKNTYTAADIIAKEYPQAPRVMSFEDITQLVQTHELVFQSRAGFVKPRSCVLRNDLTLRDGRGRSLLTIREDHTCVLYNGQLTVWVDGGRTAILMVLQARVPKHTLADDVRTAIMDKALELGLPAVSASSLAMMAYMKVAESPFNVSTPVDN
jgi:hypothetical protein